MKVPENTNEVALNLAKLSRRLDEVKDELNRADMDHVYKRESAKLAEAHAYLEAEGSIEARKKQTDVATHEVRLAAEVAEATVRGLARTMKTLQSRIDVGRTLGAGIRAEASMTGFKGES